MCYFDLYVSYCCLVWAQNFSSIKGILILQKKSIEIINFQPRNSHTNSLFKQNFILKFQDEICLANILSVRKSLNDSSPSIFNVWFSFSWNLMKRFYKTNRYGKYSITVSAAESWDKIQKQLKSILLKDLYIPQWN